MEIITTHASMDFDALASMVIAAKLHPGALLVPPSTQLRNVKEYLALNAGETAWIPAHEVEWDRVTRVIVVDTNTPKRLGDVWRYLQSRAVSVVVYDHHEAGQHGFEGAEYVIPPCPVGSTITALLMAWKGSHGTLSPKEATLCAAALYEETGCFCYRSTTPADLEMAAWLLNEGADLSVVLHFVQLTLTPAQDRLLQQLTTSLRTVDIEGVPVSFAMIVAKDFLGDLSVVVHKVRDMGSLDILFVLARLGSSLYMVGRSRVPEIINVAAVAARFGGGGHATAASAKIKGGVPRLIYRQLRRVLKDVMAEARAVRR